MIIVEGPDGSGKTTLCEWICKQFNLKMGERSEKDRDKIYKTTREDSWNGLRDECMATAPPLVWDRIGPYSEPIYASLGIPEKREIAFTPAEVHTFHHFVSQREFGLVILCLPPMHTVLENVREKPQLEGVPQKTKSIYYAYLRMMGHEARYDYTRKGGLTALGLMISLHLKERRKRERLTKSPEEREQSVTHS